MQPLWGGGPSLTVVLRTDHGDKGRNRNGIQVTGDQLGSD